jgi:hypothetical protein
MLRSFWIERRAHTTSFGTQSDEPRGNFGDLNKDGYVSIDALFTMASHFGQGLV